VVAHETVTNPELSKQCKAVLREDREAAFVLLAPATPVHHLLLRRGNGEEATTAARKLADRAKAMFARNGVQLSEAKVGAESPADAIDQEVKTNPGYAGFITSTLPKEKSRWLLMDLPRTVESKYDKPVYHVLGEPEWTSGDIP
jgi:hypothetical protein